MAAERKTVLIQNEQGGLEAVSQRQISGNPEGHRQLSIDDGPRGTELSEAQSRYETPAEMYARYLGGTALPSDKFGLLF